jgi:hypothetical protein
MEINLHDIEAVGDVLDYVAEQSDSMEPDLAIQMINALNELERKLKMARSLCETQAKRTLEGKPIKVDGKVYAERDTGKWRPSQSRIRQAIVRNALADDQGRVVKSRQAVAERAVTIMYDLFVSPSTMPKVTGLKSLGLTNEDVADWDKTGTVLKELG